MAHEKWPSPARIEEFLGGLHHPARREDPIEHARENRAPRNVLGVLQHLPDREYGNPAEVADGILEVKPG